MSTDLVTRATLAKRLGVHRSHVTRLIARGVIEVGQDGLIDFDKAVRAIGAAQDPARPRTRPAVEGEDLVATTYQEARTLKERYSALHRKLEYERALGKLLSADDVVAAWQQLVAAFRAKCLSLPSKLAPQLAMSESRHIQNVLTVAVREALEELSRFSLPRTRGNGRSTPEPGGPQKPRTTPVH